MGPQGIGDAPVGRRPWGLERHDPERQAVRHSEKDKAETPLKGSGCAPAYVDGKRRAVPEWAKREIVRRFGDRCWVKDCPDRTFLQNAHLRPARSGASNLPREQARWCPDHHRQYDAGAWFLVPKKDGSVVMFDKRGVKVGDLIRWDEVLRTPLERPPP
jgi:hypothetical protein